MKYLCFFACFLSSVVFCSAQKTIYLTFEDKVKFAAYKRLLENNGNVAFFRPTRKYGVTWSYINAQSSPVIIKGYEGSQTYTLTCETLSSSTCLLKKSNFPLTDLKITHIRGRHLCGGNGGGNSQTPPTRYLSEQGCTAGQYIKYSSCLNCPVGYHNPSNKSECISCARFHPDGGNNLSNTKRQYQNEEGKTSCKTCIEGAINEFSSTIRYMRSNRCDTEPCPAGSHMSLKLSDIDGNVNLKANLYCANCKRGRYIEDFNGEMISTHGQCKLCDEGKYDNNRIYNLWADHPTFRISVRDGSNCVSCPAGFLSSPDRNSCIACPKGFYHKSTVLTTCSVCASGQYQDKVGQTSCKECNDCTKDNPRDLRGSATGCTAKYTSPGCVDGCQICVM